MNSCRLRPSDSLRHSLLFQTMAARTKRKTGSTSAAETVAPISLPSPPQPTPSSFSESTASSLPAAGAPAPTPVPAATSTSAPISSAVNTPAVEESFGAVGDGAAIAVAPGLSTSASDNGSPHGDGDGNGEVEGAGVLSVVQPPTAESPPAGRYVSYSLGPCTI